MRFLKTFVIMLVALWAANCGNVPPDGPTPITAASATPTPNDVQLLGIYSENYGRDLRPGETVMIPDKLIFRGTYIVGSAREGAVYDVSAKPKNSSGAALVYADVPPYFATLKDGKWTFERSVIGPPALSVNGGPKSYYDTTDIVSLGMYDNTQSGGPMLFLQNISLTLKWQLR